MNAGPEAASPQIVESFARETSLGAVGDISTWSNEAVLTGMKQECEAIQSLDTNYPARYHRFGTFILESKKRFGEETTRQELRREGIDRTQAWRAEQIATLYTFPQAVAFPSLRAILKTLPTKQPRKKEPEAKPNGGGDHQGNTPQKPSQVSPVAVTEGTALDQFIQLGLKVREMFGDEAFDEAVALIKAHVPETFEEAFAEV
jgi:hypothetical protein